ncbi:MAG: class I SAM-dependent methyltransferase [Blastocatellia bacterium]
MYHSQIHAGNSPDFWEENWAASRFEESLRFCAVDPLRPLFEKYSSEGNLMLEGGCGLGQYLVYYKSKGRRVIGLDFAQQALKALHKRQSDLDLCGGVVEHFEDGAEESLKEARRVLKKDGVLMISVPYYNPLRRILSPFRKDEWRIVDTPETDGRQFFEDKKFFQYAYRASEFKNLLADSGLKVVETQGYAVIWGLYEIPFLNRYGNSAISVDEKKAGKKEIAHVNSDEIVKENNGSLLKRLVVQEDATIPIMGLGVKFLRWSSANMMMYVCTRK